MARAMQLKNGRRRLKRNMTSHTTQVEVQMQKCIKGGKRKHWMVLPTVVYMEREGVSIKSTQSWLHMMLAGTLHKSTFHHAITNFVNECRDALQKQAAIPAFLAAASGPAPLAAASSQAPPAPLQDCGASHANAKVGRAAIIQRDDSDDEDLVQPIVQRKRNTTRGWATVSVRGMDIECCCGRGRQLLVPVDGASLDLIVQHLFHRGGETLQPQRGEGAATFGELLTEAEHGKVAWRTQASSQSVGFWQITYRNQQGRVARARCGMSVPRASLAGTPLSPKEQMEAANMVLQKARAEWNRCDCSDSPRLLEFT